MAFQPLSNPASHLSIQPWTLPLDIFQKITSDENFQPEDLKAMRFVNRHWNEMVTSYLQTLRISQKISLLDLSKFKKVEDLSIITKTKDLLFFLSDEFQSPFFIKKYGVKVLNRLDLDIVWEVFPSHRKFWSAISQFKFLKILRSGTISIQSSMAKALKLGLCDHHLYKLQELKHLNHLKLENQFFVTDQSCHALAQLTQLTSLWLCNCPNITGKKLSSLICLNRLKDLKIDNLNPSELKKNGGLLAISKIPKLKSMAFGFLSASETQVLVDEKFTKIASMDILNTTPQANLSLMSLISRHFTHIGELKLCDNYHQTPILSTLTLLKRLNRLTVKSNGYHWWTNITQYARHLDHLTLLEFSNDKKLESLLNLGSIRTGTIPNLRSLIFRVSKVDMHFYSQCLNDLVNLVFNDCELSWIDHYSSLRNLRSLKFTKTHFSIPCRISQFTHMASLTQLKFKKVSNFRWNNLASSGITTTDLFPELVKLYLDLDFPFQSISNDSIKQMAGFPALKTLKIKSLKTIHIEEIKARSASLRVQVKTQEPIEEKQAMIGALLKKVWIFATDCIKIVNSSIRLWFFAISMIPYVLYENWPHIVSVIKKIPSRTLAVCDFISQRMRNRWFNLRKP